MAAARYEILSTLPPGAGTRTRLAWSTGDGGFRRAVVLREVADGAEAAVGAPAQDGVLPLLDVVELEGRKWAVYDFIAGATFAEVSNAHFSVERLPSLGLIGRVVIDAARAIHRVHDWVDPLGLMPAQRHGGISDAAVFVGFDGHVRVLDFNARRLGRFIAPEVTRGDQFDARADVFSLGAVLHHATTRFEKQYAVTMLRAPSPNEFPPPSTVHPEATPELDAVVMRALMPSPSGRFATALQLAEEIETVLGPTLFTGDQIRTVLEPLFGDRIGALKELVDPKRRPPAPRASAPKPPPRASAPTVGQRKTGSALDAVSAMDVQLDGGGMMDVEDIPTQANIKLPPGLVRPGPPVPDYDPNATGRLNRDLGTNPDLPPAGSTEEERAMALGQENISTGQYRAMNVALDGAPLLGLDEEVPTNIRQRPSQEALAKLQPEEPAYEDPKKKEPTLDVDPIERPEKVEPKKKKGKGARVVLMLLLLIIAGGGAVSVLRPDLVAPYKAQLLARIAGKPLEPAEPPQEVPLEDVVLLEDGGVAPVPVVVAADDAGFHDSGVTDSGVADGGEDEEEEEDEVSLVPGDGGHRDGGAKHSTPVKKKKKKKRRY